MPVINRAVTSKLYSGSVSNPVLLFVKQCTLSGIRIQSVVALSLILVAVKGGCICMSFLPLDLDEI